MGYFENKQAQKRALFESLHGGDGGPMPRVLPMPRIATYDPRPASEPRRIGGGWVEHEIEDGAGLIFPELGDELATLA